MKTKQFRRHLAAAAQTLSFAVDATKQSPQAAVEATQRGLPTSTRYDRAFGGSAGRIR